MFVCNELLVQSNEKIVHNNIEKTTNKKSPLIGIIQSELNHVGELVITGCNTNCKTVLGVDCKHFIGKSMLELFPSLKETDLLDIFKEVAVTGDSWSSENFQYKDDKISGVYKVDVHQNDCEKILILLQDKLLQKGKDKNNNETHSLLNNIFNGVDNIIFVLEVLDDGSFKFVDVNPAFERVAKLPAKVIRGKSPMDFLDKVSEESIERELANYKKCTEEKRIYTYEEMIVFEGLERWWLTTLNPVLSDQNKVNKIIGTSVEITNRIKAEKKLKEHETNLALLVEERTSEIQESELRFRKMAEGLCEGLRIYENGNLIYVNETFCDLLGYSAIELKSKVSMDLSHEECKELALRDIEQFNSTKKAHKDITYELVAKDGTLKRIKNRYITWKKDNGEVILYIISNDVTEKEENEERLLLQSSALNAAANGISIYDESGKIIWVNDAFSNLTGYDREELIGNSPKILKSGMHNKSYYDEMWKTVTEGSVWRGEFINKRKNGELYYDETTITPLRKNNKISHFIEIKQDISNRKEYESNLKNREEHYRSLFENSHNAIFVSDFDGKIVEINNSAKELFGLNGENGSDLNSFEFIADKIKFQDFLNNLKNKGFVKAFPCKIKRKDNSQIDCLINATLHKTESNSEVFQAILVDISDVIKAKLLLEDALKESEKASKLKSEFLGAMSHEIRTPINIILSYMGLIKSDIIDEVDEDLQSLFPAMERAGNRIIRTIDLLLNVAELNQGTYEGKFAEINLYDRVLERIYLDYKKEAHQKGLEFNLLKLTEETILNIDEYTVNEIFKNLIDNSIKYTNNGKVEIKLRKNTLGKIQVEVSDTGIGIDNSYLPDLFEPFTQEEMGYTRKFEGNGLGMALVKQYAKLNKAEINVSSSKGVGTTFMVTFN